MTQENQQEFDDYDVEDVDEEQLEKHIVSCEDCVKRILDSIWENGNNLDNLIRETDSTSYDTEKTKENEHFETQNNQIDPSLETNQSIISNDQEIISNQIDTIDHESIENGNAQLNTTESDVRSSEQNNFIKITKRKRDTSTKVQKNQVKKATSSNIDNQDGESEQIATESTTIPIQPNSHLQCSLCPKSFDHPSHLQQHVRVHTGERPFACDLCDRRFKVRGALTRHQLIHQNIKNFKCHECDKQFTQKCNLDTHLRTHSGEGSFECHHCEKSFTTLDNRNKHEQAIHLHVKPYRCKQCGHTATRQTAIIKHIRMVHFGLPHSIKEQQTRNIIDDRDAGELVEKV